MKLFVIHGEKGESIILAGEKLGNLKEYIPAENAVIITDANIRRHYSQIFPPLKVIEIGIGEKVKTLDTVQDILAELVAIEADRSSFIVGIGGGIVCDIVGFVASIYLRGVRFGFVPTTLLSQVDAGVGGKNGVNFRGYKNMVGVFNQPEFVICDADLLGTLPEREMQCGFAEVVKHAAIADAELFSYLERNVKGVLLREAGVIEKLVYDSVVIKSSIVNRDESEKGERMKLNFGHTFGHAIERAVGIPHGEAVSVGMMAAAELSKKRACLPAKDAGRIEGLLTELGLPTRLQLDEDKVFKAVKKDKKRKRDNINFVLLHSIGNAVVEEVSISELEKMSKNLF